MIQYTKRGHNHGDDTWEWNDGEAWHYYSSPFQAYLKKNNNDVDKTYNEMIHVDKNELGKFTDVTREKIEKISKY